ncbi:MAG: hypothetical protein LW875_09895 [Proteobacteria bacterium]|jgi:hypothetical protein|nr:hypothetical protein [Pseudomonadota bacterium]
MKSTSWFSFLLVLGTVPAWGTNGGFVYQGRILNPAGEPVSQTGVTVQLTVLGSSNIAVGGGVATASPVSNCILYAESHTVDTTNTNGGFEVMVGQGTSVYGSWGGQFLNPRASVSAGALSAENSALVVNSQNCTEFLAHNSTVDRKIQAVISFTDSNGAQVLDLGYMPVRSVPWALQAGTANSLTGFSAARLSNLFNLSTTLPTNSVLGTNSSGELVSVTISGGSYNSGTNTITVTSGSAATGIVNGASDPGSPSSGSVYYNTTQNNLRVYNGTAYQNVLPQMLQDTTTCGSAINVSTHLGAIGNTVVVNKDTTGGTTQCSFTTGLTTTYVPANGPRVSGRSTVYSLTRISASEVLVTWSPL